MLTNRVLRAGLRREHPPQRTQGFHRGAATEEDPGSAISKGRQVFNGIPSVRPLCSSVSSVATLLVLLLKGRTEPTK